MGDNRPPLPPPPPPPERSSPLPPPPPPPTVVGYGRRTPDADPAGRAPASMLHAQHGAQPLPRMSMQAGWPSPAPYAAPRRHQLERNPLMMLAQLLAVVQGILGVISGVNSIRAQFAFNALSRIGVPIAAGNELAVDGVIMIAISLLVIVAGLLVGRGSPALRFFLVAWEVIALAFTIAVLATFDPLLQLRDVFLVIASCAGMDFVHPWIALAIEVAIIFGLVIHPASRAAFEQ